MTFKSALLLFVVLVSCKHEHKHEVSTELKKAYEIQQSALKTNASLNAYLDSTKIELPSEIQARRDLLLKNMIEIPGMDHDHKNCNHDHKRATYQITDSEMIQVQSEWRDSLMAINKLVQDLAK